MEVTHLFMANWGDDLCRTTGAVLDPARVYVYGFIWLMECTYLIMVDWE